MTDTARPGRLIIEPLDRTKHDRAAFSCDVAAVNNFLAINAASQQDQDVTRVYVACLDGTREIVGFYAVNSHALDIASLPEALRKRLPRYPTVGAIYLSMIGVSSTHQGRGFGRYLMMDALERAERVANDVGAAFVALDALNERAAKLYRRLGFVDLPSHPGRMIIHMMQVRVALQAGRSP